MKVSEVEPLTIVRMLRATEKGIPKPTIRDHLPSLVDGGMCHAIGNTASEPDDNKCKTKAKTLYLYGLHFVVETVDSQTRNISICLHLSELQLVLAVPR